MEIFEFTVPAWVFYLSVYVVGAVAIGMPMGKWSLKAWKYPKRYALLGKMLFPHTGTFHRVGELHRVEGDMGSWDGTDLPLFETHVHKAIKENDVAVLGRYIGVTMACWPIRVLWLLVVGTLCGTGVFVFKTIPNTCTALVLRCKKCVEI